MLRWSTYFPLRNSLVSERLASREWVIGDSPDGARRKHTPGKEGDMRRITSLILVVIAIAAAALPLAAQANHGPPHGGGPTSLRAM